MAAIRASDDVGSSDQMSNIPSPPSLDGLALRKRWQRSSNICYVPRDTILLWDKIFKKCSSRHRHIVDIITTADNKVTPAHKFVLSTTSPVFDKLIREGVPSIKINVVPQEALGIFIRFLYTSCFNSADMTFVLDVLHLSHFYDVPFAEQACIKYVENRVDKKNVMDVLQVAKDCDLRRLSFICFRRIFRDYEAIKSTKGWKDMLKNNRALVEKLAQAVHSKRQEMQQRAKAKKFYMRLLKADDALVHLYEDECIRIGPEGTFYRGKKLNCTFPLCKGIKDLVHHFYRCEKKVPGRCNLCRCLWKLLELHSRICDAPRYCDVPLCSDLQEKLRQQVRKDEIKWKLLAIKVKQLGY